MKKILGVMSIILCTSSVFADNNVSCPSASMIRQNAHFSTANRLAHPGNVWQLRSNVFLYKNMMWDITFSADLDNVANEPNALKAGQAYFDSKVQLLEQPIRVKDVCIYAQDDYFVRASEHIFQPY